MSQWLRRVAFWFRSGRMAAELQEEIETHRSLIQERLERAGCEDAADLSRRALGNVVLAREDARHVWIWAWLDRVAQDVRYACRGLRRQPGFAITAILTVAIGTGTLASVLSVFHAVVLRSAPFPNADRIVQIGQVVNGRNRSEVSVADVLALRAASPSLAHVSIAWFSEASLAGSGLPQRARRVYTDSHAFQILGVKPLVGRLPTETDDAADGGAVVLIGHHIWSEWFGSDPDAIGRTLRIDGQQHVIIGVMPPGFRFPAPYWAPGDMWLLRGPSHSFWPESRARNVLAFALLKEGATIERAQAEADVTAARLDLRYPDASGRIGLQLTRWAETIRTAARPRIWMLLGATVILFVIVCVNLASLLISRGVDREREFAARVALGAGGARLASQLLTETGVLFVIGGSAGLLVAVWGARLLVALRSYDIPGMEGASVDVVVAAAAMAITMCAAAIVGLVPAVQAATARLSGLDAAGARGSSPGRRWRRMQSGLVAAEAGLALVLLCGAAVLLEGGRTLARADAGFDARGLLHARVDLPPSKYPDLRAQTAFYHRVLEALLRDPDVASAAAVNFPPGVGGSERPSILLDTDPVAAPSRRDLRPVVVRAVSVGYLEALGLAARSGRFFTSGDSPAVPIAVVNESFVRRYLGDRRPVGRTLRVAFGSLDDLDRVPRTIVGVVADVREKTLYEPAPPAVYVPLEQTNSPHVGLRMALLVRSARPPGEVVPLIRRTIAEVDPDQAAYGFMALGELMESELSLNRLNLALLSVLSTVALFLSVIGVHGLAAHVVSQRKREIGIRLALGGSRRGVVRLILGQVGLSIVFGIACGVVAAVWSGAMLRSVVHGIDGTSAITFAGAVALLSAAMAVGCCFPLRKASRIDPAAVLRSDA